MRLWHDKVCHQDKVIRHWDQAQTPYQRLVATATLSEDQYARLHGFYEQTNPLALRKEISRLLAVLWELPAPAASVA